MSLSLCNVLHFTVEPVSFIASMYIADWSWHYWNHMEMICPWGDAIIRPKVWHTQKLFYHMTLLFENFMLLAYGFHVIQPIGIFLSFILYKHTVQSIIISWMWTNSQLDTIFSLPAEPFPLINIVLLESRMIVLKMYVILKKNDLLFRLCQSRDRWRKPAVKYPFPK